MHKHYSHIYYRIYHVDLPCWQFTSLRNQCDILMREWVVHRKLFRIANHLRRRYQYVLIEVVWVALKPAGLRCRRARVQIAVATLSGNSLWQTVHTHCATVHQVAQLVAALLRVEGVTAGLAESIWQPTVGFMTHVTCRLTAKNRDQLRNPTLGNRVWATFTF